MLRPEQISNARFTPVSTGTYSAEEVDAFLSVVADAYSEQLDKNAELVKKISILAEKVEAYRKDEDAIKSALLDAHKLADNVTKVSKENAQATLDEANSQALDIKTKAESEAAAVKNAARNEAAEIVTNAKNAVASIQDRANRESNEKLQAAKAQADSIIADANKQGAAIVGSSKREFEFYTEELKKVKAELQQFRTMVEMLCNGEKKPEEIPEIPVEPDIPDFKATTAVEAPAPVVEAEPAPAVEEPVAEIPAEPETPAADKTEDDIDDLLGLFDDGDDDSDISADLDSLIPEVPAAVEASVPAVEEPVPEEAVESEVAVEPEIPSAAAVDDEEDAGDDTDDFFAEFADDLDDLDIPGESADDDDDDISSLFDSLFD